jgi:hypothetical protein
METSKMALMEACVSQTVGQKGKRAITVTFFM